MKLKLRGISSDQQLPLQSPAVPVTYRASNSCCLLKHGRLTPPTFSLEVVLLFQHFLSSAVFYCFAVSLLTNVLTDV